MINDRLIRIQHKSLKSAILQYKTFDYKISRLISDESYSDDSSSKLLIQELIQLDSFKRTVRENRQSLLTKAKFYNFQFTEFFFAQKDLSLNLATEKRILEERLKERLKVVGTV